MSNEEGVCISCLETGNLFNIFDTHECEGNEEIYVEMMKSCFDVSISKNPACNFMCERCILTLRHAYYFKLNIVKNLTVMGTDMNWCERIQVEYLDDIAPNIEFQDNIVQELDPETGQMSCIVKDYNTTNNTKKFHTEHDNNDINQKVQENSKELLNRNENKKQLSNNNKDTDYFKYIKKENKKNIIIDELNGKNIKDDGQNGTEEMKVTQYECAHCSKKFSSKKSISRHLKSHIVGEYTCHICNRMFTKENSRNCHLWRAHQTEPYACAVCAARFRTFHQRLQHLRAAHAHRHRYPCPHCDNVYSYASARWAHVRQTHERVLNHCCAHCRMKFYKRRELLSHMASIHGIGEKKHVCPICDKSFYRSTVMRLHMRTHMKHSGKEKRFKCTICPAEFTYQTVLRNHLKLHELQMQEAGIEPQTVDKEDVVIEDEPVQFDESNGAVYFEIDVN